MGLVQKLKHAIGLRSPVRIAYHWCCGVFAYLISGNPAKGIYIIGVTGTKGKTTTSTLIAKALEESGKTVALFTTAQVWLAGDKRENRSKMTMDSPFKLWKFIREAKKAGVTHLVLETSSHGIYYFRNFGVKYDAVLLTNISQDHLDLHGTMSHYVHTKARLFKPEVNKIRVLPKDCEYFDIFYAASEYQAVTYSMSQSADYETQMFSMSPGSIQLLIHSESPIVEDARLVVPLSGKFNAENVLAAYSLLRSIGIETQTISKAWEDFTGVPGRMEAVPNNKGITVLVDYAHTEKSIESVLETLKSGSSTTHIILVFGATGDRDTTKRPKMGTVADILADVIVLTDDDTYTEDSMRIIDMIRTGIDREIGDTFQVIPDRESAILWALDHAKKGDTVVIAGKGCETLQITNKGPIPWSDRGIVEKYFQ